METRFFSEKGMLKHALQHKYAVGAFNFSSIEVMRAIVDAANQANSPVILAVSETGLKYGGPAYISSVMAAVLKESSVPISLHLDHGKTFETVKQVIDCGFNSVMIDGSYLDYEENVALTKKVCDYAHERGVDVEGELGVLAGIEDNVKAEKVIYTDPKTAEEFVARTGVDSLAIAIGTSHGAFKFSGTAELRFDILEKVSELMPELPIVLHGASNVPPEIVEQFNRFGGNLQRAQGVPEEMVKKACKMSVCKVNCDTDLRISYTAAIRQYLAEHPECFTPRDYLQFAKDLTRELVVSKMKNILGSAGKAKDFSS